MFRQKVEKDLFNPENTKIIWHNLSNNKKNSLDEIKDWDKNSFRV